MKAIGIDVSAQTSKDVKQFVGEEFDYVITVCDRAKQQCPIFPGVTPIHWSFDDPADASAEKQAAVFTRVRDEISHRLRLFALSNRD
jgi:arsenate reductase (thioredoxin)